MMSDQFLDLSDQELLLLAAQAAGLNYIKECVWIKDGFYSPFNPHERIHWNPLKNADDVFDLMLKLSLRFEYFSVDPFELSGKPVCVVTWAPGGEHRRIITITETGNTAGEVLRRTIVKAAAKIELT